VFVRSSEWAVNARAHWHSGHSLTSFGLGATIAYVITVARDARCICTCYTSVGSLCTRGGLHRGGMGTEDRFGPLTWMAVAFEIVGAWVVADVPAVAYVRLSDRRRRRRIDGRPFS
jgi:hypothetical protein